MKWNAQNRRGYDIRPGKIRVGTPVMRWNARNRRGLGYTTRENPGRDAGDEMEYAESLTNMICDPVFPDRDAGDEMECAVSLTNMIYNPEPGGRCGNHAAYRVRVPQARHITSPMRSISFSCRRVKDSSGKPAAQRGFAADSLTPNLPQRSKAGRGHALRTIPD